MNYWNEEGKYQAQADQISKDIPSEGHAKTLPVELFRCAQNVYYEIYNNGGCNLGMEAIDDRFPEFSKNTQLQHIASYEIDTSKIDDLIEKMVEEYENDYYDNSESEEMVKILCNGYMDQLLDSVIEKCQELGYKFQEALN